MIKTTAASKKGQKASFVSRVGMTVLTVVLIVLFFFIMMLVSRIQGTARVVNYAGLVRGETQRIIKLEGAGLPQDGMIEDVAAFIAGMRYGSDELDLVCLNDDAFQTKMEELDNYFTGLKAEILLVRQKGYQNTAIIEMSEEFFMICDEATGLAEEYSQHMASELNQLERIVVVDILGLVILIALELVKALRYAAANRVLQSKVYLDEATGLPNKNKCEELLDRTEPLEKWNKPQSVYLTRIICVPSTIPLAMIKAMNIFAILRLSCAKAYRQSILLAVTAGMSLLQFCMG